MKDASRERHAPTHHLYVLHQEAAHDAGTIEPDVTFAVHGWLDYLCSCAVYKQQMRTLTASQTPARMTASAVGPAAHWDETIRVELRT